MGGQSVVGIEEVGLVSVAEPRACLPAYLVPAWASCWRPVERRPTLIRFKKGGLRASWPETGELGPQDLGLGQVKQRDDPNDS